MMRKLNRRTTIRRSCTRVCLPALLAAAAGCGTDSILDGGNGGGGGGGGGGTPVGRTYHAAPSAAFIGDITVDADRGVLYVSNKSNNSVDVISWSGDALTRAGRVLVGSLPWGMTLDGTGDTLVVANSGGTSLSFVDVGTQTEARRFEAANSVLWQLSFSDGTVILSHHDFSDRPQHVATDAAGVLLYSTQPTAAAPDGSIRMVRKSSTWSQRESDLLLWTQVVDGNGWGPGMDTPVPCFDPVSRANYYNEDVGCVIAFVDSVRIHYEAPTLGTQFSVFDHVPGNPSQVISVTSSSFYDIYTNLRAAGSDIFFYVGNWQLADWMNADTTFVAASGDGSSIAIAEGSRSPGRVWFWGESGAQPPLFNRWISDVVNISNYTNNTATEISGISLNHVGNVIVTRGANSVFFLTTPAQLRGTYNGADIGGGVGVAVHPRAGFDGADPTVDWAVAGGAGPELVIVDTRHFRRVGRITIMERVAGQLRVIDRLPADAPDVVGHVFGVMGSGRVFHTPITVSDINP